MNATTKVNVGFRVKFWTEWGQNLVVCGSTRRLGGWDVRKGLWMHCQVRVVEPIRSINPSNRLAPRVIRPRRRPRPLRSRPRPPASSSSRVAHASP
jgi:hypothetical protein